MASALTVGIIAALYVYSGHQTWWRMLLTDPQAHRCEITTAVRNGTLPFWVYGLFVIFWLPLMIVGWSVAKTG